MLTTPHTYARVTEFYNIDLSLTGRRCFLHRVHAQSHRQKRGGILAERGGKVSKSNRDNDQK